MARPTGRALRDELVAGARTLIQQVGVRGFSYGELAKQLHIKSPSIHHHFRRKQDLVAEVAKQYRTNFMEHVNAIEGTTGEDRLLSYANLFAETTSKDLLCLCGAVAAEWASVGHKPRRIVENFFREQQAWLQNELAQGVAKGEFRADLDVETISESLFAALEGSMLLVRANGNAKLPITICSAMIVLISATKR